MSACLAQSKAYKSWYLKPMPEHACGPTMLPLIAFRLACLGSSPARAKCCQSLFSVFACVRKRNKWPGSRRTPQPGLPVLARGATKSMVIGSLARRFALQKQRTRCEDFEQTLRRKAQPAPMIGVTTWLARPACKQTPPNGQAVAPMPALSLTPVSHTCPAFVSCVATTTTRRHPTALKKDDCSRC